MAAAGVVVTDTPLTESQRMVSGDTGHTVARSRPQASTFGMIGSPAMRTARTRSPWSRRSTSAAHGWRTLAANRAGIADDTSAGADADPADNSSMDMRTGIVAASAWC